MSDTRERFILALVNAGVPRERAEFRATQEFGPVPDSRDPAIDEKREQAEVVKRFRAFGFHVYTLSQPRATKQTPGLPDLWCAHNTQPIAFWWETKRQVGGELSSVQVEFQAECHRCGVGHGVGDRYAADDHLILLGLAERLPDGSLYPVTPNTRDLAAL